MLNLKSPCCLHNTRERLSQRKHAPCTRQLATLQTSHPAKQAQATRHTGRPPCLRVLEGMSLTSHLAPSLTRPGGRGRSPSILALLTATPHLNSPALLTAVLHRDADLSPHLIVSLVADAVFDGVSPILIVHGGAFTSAQGISHGPDLQQHLCPTLSLLLAAGVAALQPHQSALVPATLSAMGRPSHCFLLVQLCSSISLCRSLTGTLCSIITSALPQTCTLPMHGE